MELRQEIDKIVAEVGTVGKYTLHDGQLSVTIELHSTINALAKSVKRAVDAMVVEAGYRPLVVLSEPRAKKAEPKKYKGLEGVKRIIAVASGKGGVGKSSVAAALAKSLCARGQRVGVLDADIYGPSQPQLFNLEGFRPVGDEDDMIEPPLSAQGIAVMSIGFFIEPSDALVWRGPMATSALRQLIHQTAWGELDTLVVDLPPGTGDVHLTVCSEMRLDGAFIVTTPSDLALSDVVRGIKMLRSEHIAVEVLGIICNMAYFAPADAPDKRYYIFGSHDKIEQVSQSEQLPILVEVPLVDVVGTEINPAIFDTLL